MYGLLSHPNDEGGLKFDDPDIGIDWPVASKEDLIMSDMDTKWGGIKEYTASRNQ